MQALDNSVRNCRVTESPALRLPERAYACLVLFSLIGLFVSVVVSGVAACPIQALAQTDSTGAVEGVVRTTDGEPVPGANVFAANTTFGAMTDTTGRYRFTLPAGQHNLVVSAVGHERYTSFITVRPGSTTIVSPRLREITYNLPDVTVQTGRGRWQSMFQKFRRRFLGTSRNAAETTIKNKYQLHFDRSGDAMTAASKEPLRIVNCSLGYITTFHLDRFRWHVGTSSLQMGGWPRHTPLETIPDTTGCKVDPDKWERRRVATYQGSLQHFLRAVGEGTLESHNFYIRIDQTVSPTEISDIQSGRRLHVEGPLNFRAQPAEEIRGKRRPDGTFQISFGPYLRIICVPDRPVKVFPGRGTPEISWLTLSKDSVTVFRNGQVLDPYALTQLGILTKRGIADLLPYEYRP